MDSEQMAEEQRQGGRREMFLQAVRYYRSWSDEEQHEVDRESFSIGPSSYGQPIAQLATS
jgi:hypothetical protein